MASRSIADANCPSTSEVDHTLQATVSFQEQEHCGAKFVSSQASSRMDNFESLVQALRDRLGTSSGIDSEDIDPDEVQSMMKNHISDEAEWKKYAFEQPSRAYTRNLVDKGNGKCNLLILVWSPGKSSPIHDHSNAHCIMKILKGELKETRYAWPTVQLNNDEKRPLEIERETVYARDEVTYMSDKLGLHKISNLDPDNYAISLHLYTPPNAAVYGCHTFNEQSGHATHTARCGLYSEYGHKL